jgi:Ni,Fe-hydrogenase III large subunit
MFRIRNGARAPLEAIPIHAFDEFRQRVIDDVENGARVSAFFGRPSQGKVRLTAVLSEPDAGTIGLMATDVAGKYPSLTEDCAQLHWFERELAEIWPVIPDGHPWLKPVRRLPGPFSNFYRVEGEPVHEVAVGPVHAGVIEPGHFRFQCHGEEVLHLEIALGYQHRGVERAMLDAPAKRQLPYVETLAGDTSVGHATAYARVVEALGGLAVPARGEAIRAVGLELERLANHVGDLGTLANDVAFAPTAAYCGAHRGTFLNLTEALCGSRFGRGLIRPGGVSFDLTPQLLANFRRRLRKAIPEVLGAVDLLFGSPSVIARFQGTGRIWRSQSQGLGLVGVAARACGVARDVRFEFPVGLWRTRQIPVATWHSGDVFARALVRRLEIERSLAFIDEILSDLPEGPIRATESRSASEPATGGEVRSGPGSGRDGRRSSPAGTEPPRSALATASGLEPESIAVGMVEGWRGEICHVAVTDADGRLSAYKVVDPSFHNWQGLSLALRDQAISDFPLCNKSFNLSSCGHDL